MKVMFGSGVGMDEVSASTSAEDSVRYAACEGLVTRDGFSKLQGACASVGEKLQ